MSPKWLTDIFCPTLGIIILNIRWLTPWKPVNEAISLNDLKNINPIPYFVMIFNCSGWISFAVQSHDYFVFFGNMFGLILGFYYGLSTIMILSSSPMKADVNKAKFYCHSIVGILFFWLLIDLIAGITLQAQSNSTNNVSSLSNSLLLIGIVCDIAVICNYASPLSTMFQVIRTHDSSSIDFPFVVMNIANSLLWFSYGYFAKNNPLLYIPNIVGIVVTGLEIFLYLAFKAKKVAVIVSQKISERISNMSSRYSHRPDASYRQRGASISKNTNAISSPINRSTKREAVSILNQSSEKYIEIHIEDHSEHEVHELQSIEEGSERSSIPNISENTSSKDTDNSETDLIQHSEKFEAQSSSNQLNELTNTASINRRSVLIPNISGKFDISNRESIRKSFEMKIVTVEENGEDDEPHGGDQLNLTLTPLASLHEKL